MVIHIIEGQATADQITQMQEALGDYIFQENVWGAGWYPGALQVTFDSLISIRPRQGNRALEIQDATLRDRIERIIRERLTL